MLKSPIIYVLIFESREEIISSSAVEKFSVHMSILCLYTKQDSNYATWCVWISKFALNNAIFEKKFALALPSQEVIFNIKCSSTFVRLVIICSHIIPSNIVQVLISLVILVSQIPITAERKWYVIHPLSGRIGKVVASHAVGCKVARSNPCCGWAAVAYVRRSR